MSKYEKLIEYIINDEDQKARELFHDIVVEKSRDIYESIMSEEEMEENVHSQDDVEDMVSELEGAEAVGEDEEEGEEFSFDQDGENDEVAGEMPAEHGDEEGHDEAGEEDKIMNIDAKLDELLAKFDEIMGDDGSEQDDSGMPADAMGGDEFGAEEVPSEEPEMFEAKEGSAQSGKSGNPFAKKGSAQSGKSGSAKSGVSGKSGSGKMESRSSSELMREYVEKIQDMNLTGASEGDAVGAAGKKTSVNDKSITGPGNDFGGTTATPKGGEQNQDGTSPAAAPKPQEIKSGNRNVPGGKAGSQESTGKEYSKAGDAEGQTTDGKVAVATKSVQAQNTGKK